MAVLLFFTSLIGSAHALDVHRRIDGEVVVVSAVLPHGIEDVSALLAKGAATMRIGRETRNVKARSMANGCTELTVVSRGFGRDLSYVAERCPTGDGFHSKMISSEDFDAHEIWWVMVPVEGGTEVTIRVLVKPKIPIPHFVIRRMVGGALSETLTRMSRVVGQQQLAQ